MSVSLNHGMQRAPDFRPVCILRQWRGAAPAERLRFPRLWMKCNRSL